MDFKKLLNWRKAKKQESQKIGDEFSEVEVTEEINEAIEDANESTESTVSEKIENAVEEPESPRATGEEECFSAVRELFEEATTNAMLSMPMWMRLNYFANTFERGGDDTNINWDKVNHFLMLGIDKKKPYYNICGRIHNLKQLRKAAMDAQMAFIPEFDLPFYRRKCKQCGDTFDLTIGEINSYEKKNLKIPCRCYHCRKGINKQTGEHIVPKQKEEENVKTAMQIAMEKAGVSVTS